MAGTPDMVHVYFNPSIAPVLNASVTSFCQIALQPGASEDEVKTERARLVGSPSVHPVSASLGRAVERAEYILAEGWEVSVGVGSHVKLSCSSHLTVGDRGQTYSSPRSLQGRGNQRRK